MPRRGCDGLRTACDARSPRCWPSSPTCSSSWATLRRSARSPRAPGGALRAVRRRPRHDQRRGSDASDAIPAALADHRRVAARPAGDPGPASPRFFGVSADTSPARCAAARGHARRPGADRVAMLVMGDASARRSLQGPGLPRRAGPAVRRVGRPRLADADTDALLASTRRSRPSCSWPAGPPGRCWRAPRRPAVVGAGDVRRGAVRRQLPRRDLVHDLPLESTRRTSGRARRLARWRWCGGMSSLRPSSLSRASFGRPGPLVHLVAVLALRLGCRPTRRLVDALGDLVAVLVDGLGGLLA